MFTITVMRDPSGRSITTSASCTSEILPLTTSAIGRWSRRRTKLVGEGLGPRLRDLCLLGELIGEDRRLRFHRAPVRARVADAEGR